MAERIVTPEDFKENDKGQLERVKTDGEHPAQEAESAKKVDPKLYKQHKKKAEEAEKYYSG